MADLPTRRRFMQGVGLAGLGLLAGCGLLPGQASSQTAKVHRIGRLSGSMPNASSTVSMSAFRQGMREFGYVEGQNLRIDEHYANGDDQLAEPTAELVRLQPDVILVSSRVAARSVLAVTSTIPIVTAGSADLVGGELAASHARPGGNVTGLSAPSLAGKQLQLLQEAVPSLARVAVLFHAPHPEFSREPYEAAAQALGLQVQFVGANLREHLEPVFETAIREHADGLFVAGGLGITGNQRRVAELAILSRLPSMWALSEAVGRGGLLAYGPNRADGFRRAAYYVDRLLQGAKPTDLPIEQPMRFDFSINLQTAQALGLTIPQHVLLQATEVIQ